MSSPAEPPPSDDDQDPIDLFPWPADLPEIHNRLSKNDVRATKKERLGKLHNKLHDVLTVVEESRGAESTEYRSRGEERRGEERTGEDRREKETVSSVCTRWR